MGLEQQCHGIVASTARSQFVQNIHQSERVVTGARGENDADGIRLIFGAFIEAPCKYLGAGADHVVDDRRPVIPLRNLRTSRQRSAFLHHRDMVAADDMADFMGEHARQLRLSVENVVEAAGQHHIAAGRGERIDRRGVDHRKTPRQIRPLALQRNPAADAVHIGLQRGIINQVRGAKHATGDLAPHGLFILFADAGHCSDGIAADAEQAVKIDVWRLRKTGGTAECRRQQCTQDGHIQRAHGRLPDDSPK